jgi:hypothetical protein
MEYPRREFLRLFGGLLASLAVGPSPAVHRRDELYLNRRLGFTFQQPPDWTFVQVADMGEMQAGQLLEVPTDVNQWIMESMDLPVVALEWKHGGPGGIQWWRSELVYHDPVEDMLRESFPRSGPDPELSFSPAMRIVRRDWNRSRCYLKDFRCSDLPEECSIDGFPAARYTASYQFDHKLLAKPTKIRTQSIAIEHRTLYHLIRLHDSGEYPLDFSRFLESIHLA